MHNAEPFYIRSHLFAVDGRSALKDLLLVRVIMNRIDKMGRYLCLPTVDLNFFFF